MAIVAEGDISDGNTVTRKRSELVSLEIPDLERSSEISRCELPIVRGKCQTRYIRRMRLEAGLHLAANAPPNLDDSVCSGCCQIASIRTEVRRNTSDGLCVRGELIVPCLDVPHTNRMIRIYDGLPESIRVEGISAIEFSGQTKRANCAPGRQVVNPGRLVPVFDRCQTPSVSAKNRL